MSGSVVSALSLLYAVCEGRVLHGPDGFVARGFDLMWRCVPRSSSLLCSALVLLGGHARWFGGYAP